MSGSILHEIASRFGGEVHGTYCLIPGPGHSPHDRSVKVWVRGGRVFCHSFSGDDWKDLRRHLGLDAGFSRRRVPTTRQDAQTSTASDADKTKRALTIWSRAIPAAGTPAETYLLSRGITIPPPADIRFLPRAWHAPTGTEHPVMVALVRRGIDGEPVAIHRTFLAADGRSKAAVDPSKMMLGPCAGGAVQLGGAGNTLMVGEGIETVLAATQATGRPGWAALSTSGLKRLALPEPIDDVIILADGDPPGEAAAKTAARRWVRPGRRVRIARPPQGQDFADTCGHYPAVHGGEHA